MTVEFICILVIAYTFWKRPNVIGMLRYIFETNNEDEVTVDGLKQCSKEIIQEHEHDEKFTNLVDKSRTIIEVVEKNELYKKVLNNLITAGKITKQDVEKYSG
jgi:hypothetical protein